LSEGYADQAVKLLLRAEKAGWFGVPGRRAALGSEPDFQGITSRPELRELLREPAGKPAAEGG
jgi:hypothetical protein